MSGTEICCLQPAGQLRHGQTEGDHPQPAGAQHTLHCVCRVHRGGPGADGSEGEDQVARPGAARQIQS